MGIRIVRFALTGGVATAIHVAVAFSCISLFGAGVFPANIAGFALAFCFSYTAQTLLVFKQQIGFGNAMKFFVVQLFALSASQLISEGVTGINKYVQVLLVVAILPLITYLIHKLWTFPSAHRR